MQRALVTGATGFIGGHLAAALVEQGVETRCLVRRTSDTSFLESLGVGLLEGDVTHSASLAAAVSAVDTVFHLAGVITTLDKGERERVNAQSPGLIANACARRDDPPTLVLLSSMAAAGPAPRQAAIDEARPPAPVSLYGHSKLAGERAAAQSSAQVPLTIVRPGIIFGPRDRLTLPIFKTIAEWGVHPVVGLGATPMSLLHVDDLVDLLLAIADSGERLPGEETAAATGRGIYFAADEHCPSYRQLGVMIGRALEKRVLPLPSLPAFARLAAGANQLWDQIRGRATPFNVDKIREARVPSWAVSSAKARRDLHWSPRQPLEHRLRETAAWYLEHNWLKLRRLRPSRHGSVSKDDGSGPPPA